MTERLLIVDGGVFQNLFAAGGEKISAFLSLRMIIFRHLDGI